MASGKFEKGKVANPRGRPKGCKDKYTQVREAIIAEFVRRGQVGLQEYSDKYPDGFYRLVVGVLPKEQDINLNAVMRVELVSNVDES